MSGFEIVGIALAGPAIVEQLLRTSIDGYRAFQDAKLAGKGIQQYRYELEVTRLRLEDWVHALSKCGGNLAVLLGERSRRYQLVLETLALIAGVFAQVEQLEKKYGVSRLDPNERITGTRVVEEERLGTLKGWYRRLIPSKRVLGAGSSRYTSPVSKPSRSLTVSKLETLPSSNLPFAISSEDAATNDLCEVDLEVEAPGLGEHILRMERMAQEYQRTLSTFRKYEWVFSSREELQLLIEDLKKYIACLEALTNTQFQVRTLALSTPFNGFRVLVGLPFSRLSTFSGREEILMEIKEHLHLMPLEESRCSHMMVIVLHGMGGIGKSQVALEYVYRNRGDYSAVFWINVTNPSTMNSSGRQIIKALISHYATKYPSSPDFARIATDIGIPGQIDSMGQLIDGSAAKSTWQGVKSWLAKEENVGWCLIADGINDESDAVRLREALPACAHGHVIVTSRVTVPGCDHIISIPVMDKESGLKLLLGGNLEGLAEATREAVEKIAEKLGNLPLALAQAVAYMATRSLDFDEYLRRLCEDLSRSTSRPFPSYTEGVFSCWKLSAEALNESNPDAIALLRLCSFLSPEGISSELLSRGLKAMDWLDNDMFRLNDAIDDLVRYALMKRKSSSSDRGGSRSLWIHPLVQHWARESYCQGRSVILEHDPKRLAQLRREGATRAVCLVGCGVKSDFFARESCEWIYERENMAHLNVCFDEYIPNYIVGNDDIVNERLASALRKLGSLKSYWSDYHSSADLLRESIRFYERLPAADRDTETELLLAKQDLVYNYLYQDSRDVVLEDIELLVNEVARRQRRLLGELHQHTLWSMLMQAKVAIAKEDVSLELIRQCMENNRRALSPGDPVSMATFSAVAGLHRSRGEYDRALEFYSLNVDLQLKYQGLNHQDTLIALTDIANFKQRCLGDLQGACEAHRHAAEGYESTFGLANPNTLKAIQELRGIYLCINQFDDALRATEKFLESWEILNGEENSKRDDMVGEIEAKRALWQGGLDGK